MFVEYPIYLYFLPTQNIDRPLKFICSRIIFLSFAISTEEMGNKIYKMSKMNFDLDPIILTREVNIK